MASVGGIDADTDQFFTIELLTVPIPSVAAVFSVAGLAATCRRRRYSR